jgi:hypothetical protein
MRLLHRKRNSTAGRRALQNPDQTGISTGVIPVARTRLGAAVMAACSVIDVIQWPVETSNSAPHSQAPAAP